MADFGFEPPSFSLGIDFDLESQPPSPNPIPPPAKPRSDVPSFRLLDEEDDDDFVSPVRVSEPPRALKRLRRVTTARPPAKEPKVEYDDQRCNVDDDIEDFSDDDCPRACSLPSNSVCCSSKPSLQGKKAVSSDSGTQWISRKGKELPSASASINVQTRGNNVIFPKLTISPLRRFQLIDSDSDNPSTIEETHKEVPSVIFSTDDKKSDVCKEATFGNQRTKTSSGRLQSNDLWQDFGPNQSSSIPTPAFDEFCEEYFTGLGNKSMPKFEPKICCKQTDSGTHMDKTSRPPALCYFFHNDSRIQKLVRERLPHFFPLEVSKNKEDRQQNVSVIDYMGQFSGEQNSRQTNCRQNVEKNTKRSKRKTKASQVDSVSEQSENWVNPKSCAGVQKSAGGRKAQAVSGPSGHWYTGQDGRRVYVARNGQELTGQIAYRQYRKDSGISRNSKTKTAANKKTASRKTVPKK